MTPEQFAALKPGDLVVFEGTPAIVGLRALPDGHRVLIHYENAGVWVTASMIDLPDTETPPLFEEDGA